MISKLFEIRDDGTFIAVLATKFVASNESERYMFSRTGYGKNPTEQLRYVFLAKIDGSLLNCTYDPYGWGSTRTMPVAHQYIIDHFDELNSGDVVDVEFILGERKVKKISESVQ